MESKKQYRENYKVAPKTEEANEQLYYIRNVRMLYICYIVEM
jgi:hypothetical protein